MPLLYDVARISQKKTSYVTSPICFLLITCIIIGVAANNAVAGQSLKFGSFDGLRNIKLSIADSNGTPVTFALSGGGYGEIAGNSNFTQITLSGTTEKSLLSIKTVGRGTKTSVGDIISSGPLKAIMATTTNLRGSINVGGGLSVLMLADVIDANTIAIGTSSNPKISVHMFFDRVRNLCITSGMPIGMLKLTEWLDSDETADQIIAPCLSMLRVVGDKKCGITGNFEAGIQLSGVAGKTTLLNNAQVAGDLKNGVWDINGDAGIIRIGSLSTTMTIHGNVGSVQMNMLRGMITIKGDARTIRVNEPLAVCVPQTGRLGQLHVEGTALVRSDRENLKLISGDLYTSTPQMYALEGIRGYDVPGSSWYYTVNRMIRSIGINESGTDDIVINVDTATGNRNGHECRVINTVSAIDGNSSTLWYTNDAGTHFAGWSIDGAIGRIDIQTDVLASPPFLELGQKYLHTAPFTGQWAATVNGQQIAGTITGSAQISSKLVGHEQVFVHTGTCLAAKVEEVWSMSGDMQLEYNGMQYQGKFLAKAIRTWSGVPGVGIVESTNNETVQILMPGTKGLSMAVKSTYELAGFDLPEVSE